LGTLTNISWFRWFPTTNLVADRNTMYVMMKERVFSGDLKMFVSLSISKADRSGNWRDSQIYGPSGPIVTYQRSEQVM
jgi:hypothetical protein